MRALNEPPFDTRNAVEFPVELDTILGYSRELSDGWSRGVSIPKFKALLKDHIRKLTIRTQEFLNIRKGLDERGFTIEQAISQIKNTTDKMEDIGVEMLDLVTVIEYSGYKMQDGREKLQIVMDTFEKSIYGEVSAADVVIAFKNAHIGVFEETEAVGADELVRAKRYFTDLRDVVDEICAEIDDRNITDFGLTLKDNDMFHEGKISNKSFF